MKKKRGGKGRVGVGRGGELKCYRQTYRHTEDEAGPRGAFAPNK